jgi:hypothetical protein
VRVGEHINQLADLGALLKDEYKYMAFAVATENADHEGNAEGLGVS